MQFKKIKQELKLLWKFYFIYILFGLMAGITAPVFMLFYLNAGLSFTQIGVVFGISIFLGLLAEIPTGAIADIYGRKVSVGLAFLLMGITWMLFPIFPYFVPLLILVSLADIFATLRTGAFSAWCVDFLKQKRRKDLVHNYYAHNSSISGIGYMLGGLSSVVIVALFGIPSVWFFAGGTSIAIALFIFIFGEEKFKKTKTAVKDSVKNTTKVARQGILFVFKHPVLLMYILAMFFIGFSNVITMTWQPLLTEVGMSPSSLGFLIASLGFVGIFFPLLSKKFLKLFKGNEKNAIIFANILLIILVFLFAFISAPWQGVILFLLALIIVDLHMPIENTFTQSFIPSKQRATVGSVIEMVFALSFSILFLLNGIVIDLFGIRGAMIIFASFSLIGVIFLVMMKPEGIKREV